MAGGGGHCAAKRQGGGGCQPGQTVTGVTHSLTQLMDGLCMHACVCVRAFVCVCLCVHLCVRGKGYVFLVVLFCAFSTAFVVVVDFIFSSL